MSVLLRFFSNAKYMLYLALLIVILLRARGDQNLPRISNFTGSSIQIVLCLVKERCGQLILGVINGHANRFTKPLGAVAIENNRFVVSSDH